MKNVSKLWRKRSKSRGQAATGLGLFVVIGVALTIIAVVLGVGAFILNEVYDEFDPGAQKLNETTYYPYNITNSSLGALNTAASWLNIYTIVAIAVGIIGMIFMFAGGTSGGGYSRGGGGGGRTRL